MRGGSLFLILAAALVAVPLLSSTPDEIVPWALVLVLASLMGTALAVESRREGFFDVFSPLAMATWGVALTILIPAILRLLLPPGAVTAHGIPYVTTGVFAEALMLGILGFTAMYAGYVVGVGRQVVGSLPVPPAEWHHGRAFLVVLAYTAVGLTAYQMLVGQFGGYGGFLSVAARSSYVQEDSLFLFAGAVIMRVGVLVALTGWIFRRDGRRPPLMLILFVVLVLGLTILLRGRGRAISILVMALFMYHFARRRLRFRQFVLLAFGSVAVLTLLDVLFAWMSGFNYDPTANLVQNLGQSKKLDKLGTMFMVLQAIPGELDYQWGSTILAVPFDFIPSSWYPNHPEGAAHVFTRTFFPSAYRAGVGIPPSLWTELYMNFGSVGVAGGAFVFGVWIDGLRRMSQMVRSHPSLLLVFVTLLYYTFALMSSVLETSVPHMVVDVAPAAGAALFVTRFRLHRQRTGAPAPVVAPRVLPRPARPGAVR